MFTPSTINLVDLQKTLFCVAYKMIGEIAPSEDIVQDTITAYLEKSAKRELSHIQNLKKYLITATTNRSINYLKRIKKERANYFGVWLPEPILNESQLIDFQLDMDYGITFLLSYLQPKERAVFILKHGFDFTFKEIGEALQLKEATCRKTFQRLQVKLTKEAQQVAVKRTQKERLLKAFLAVGKTDGLDHLIAILKEDIVIYSDGGGKKSAAKVPLVGITICSKFLLGLFKKKGTELRTEYAMVNGAPALKLYDLEDTLDTIVVLNLDDFQINKLFFIRNPDKFQL